jgi:hypothetical protein
MKPTPSPEARCERCGWPLKERVEDGCVKGNCSMRPIPKAPIGGYKPEARVDWEEKLTDELENKILMVVGEANLFNGFTIEEWEKKHPNKVLCQVVNELCRQTIHAAFEKGREAR